MTKEQSQRMLKASRILGLEMRIEQTKPEDFTVSFFNASDLRYSNYQAARQFILSREVETGKST